MHRNKKPCLYIKQGLIKGRTKYERTIAGGRRQFQDAKFITLKKLKYTFNLL